MSDPDLSFDVEHVHINKLKPHPENYREHPPEQIEEIRASIQEYGIYKNIVVANDLTILAGHGVVHAADMEDYTKIPVRRLNVGPDSSAAKRLLVGDNELPRLASDDDDQLATLLEEIERKEEDNLSGTGFEEDDFEDLLNSLGRIAGDEPDADKYSQKIETPVYEPSGDKPDLSTLFDNERTEELLSEIEQADIPNDVAEFLRLAAYRHTRFNFEDIAEYYAHAPAEVQRLMERSALVIIDFDQAVEEGFVQLAESIRDILIDDDGLNA